MPEPYTYKLGVIAAKSLEKLLITKEMIIWLCVRVKFLRGYKQPFVFGSKVKITDLNSKVETCCLLDFRISYRYRFDTRTKICIAMKMF